MSKQKSKKMSKKEIWELVIETVIALAVLIEALKDIRGWGFPASPKRGSCLSSVYHTERSDST